MAEEEKQEIPSELLKNELQFTNLILFNIIVFFVATIIILTIFCFTSLSSLHYLSLPIYFLTICFDMFAEFHYYKEIFRNDLLYSYGNIHLYKKYILLAELFAVVCLAFLIGLASPFFSLFHTEEAEFLNFFVCSALACLSCMSAGTKCMLEYTFSVWDSTHKKHGHIPLEANSKSSKISQNKCKQSKSPQQ